MNICLFAQEELFAQQDASQPMQSNLHGRLASRDERALHIKKILHKTTGQTFTAGIIGGAAGIATITKIGTAGNTDEDDIYFSFEPRSKGKPLFPLNMIIGFPRPIQLKRLLRDMAALGVQSVHLAGTELGEKSYLDASLSQPEEIHKMLLEGTVQAGGTHIPQNYVYPTLADCLDNHQNCHCERSVAIRGTGDNSHAELVSASHNEPIKIALDNVAPQTSLVDFLKQNPPQNKEVFAAIGSERGWSDNERKLLEQHGFVRLGMGERIMRTETAATVAAAIILAEMGKLQ